MLALIVLLSPAPPSTAELVGRLDSPRFAVREAAERDLRRRLSYPQVLALALQFPRSLEASRRLERVIDGWYHVGTPAGGWPRLDALEGDGVFRRRYLERQPVEENWLNWLACGEPFWPDAAWREATACYVADLAKLRVPPAIVRAVLAHMAAREARWAAEDEARRAAEWRRMPDPIRP